MKATPVIHHARTLLGIVFVFAALSLRAQAPGDSTFSISPGDVTEATIDTSGRTRLHLTLTPEKRAELSAFTGRNLNKQVKIVVGGKLRSEPFIAGSISLLLSSLSADGPNFKPKSATHPNQGVIIR